MAKNDPYAATAEQPVDPYAATAEGSSSPTSQQDFSAPKDNKEGTYRMVLGGKTIPVPYSKVQDAWKAGYRMHPDDISGFVKGAAVDPNLKNLHPAPGVKVTGLNSAGQPILAPEEQKANWSVGHALSTAGSVLSDTASGLYHAVKEGPQNPEEAEWDKRGLLTTYRLVIAPMMQQATAGAHDLNAAMNEKSPQRTADIETGIAHTLATAIPGVGPWAAQVGEQGGKKFGEKDYAGAGGVVAGNAAIYAAPHVVGRVGKLVAKAPGLARSAAEAITDTSPREVGKIAEKTQRLNDIQNRRYDRKLAKSESDTRGAEIGHEVAEREANAKAQDALDAKNEESRKKVDAANLEQIKKESQDRLDAQEKNKANIKNYKEEVRKTKEENNQKLQAEKNRQKVTSDYKSASVRLRDKYIAAFKKATTDYNNTWNTWRGMVKGVQAPIKSVVDAIESQEKSMDPQKVGIFREIMNESEPDPTPKPSKVVTGFNPTGPTSLANAVSSGLKDIPAERLHTWKSQLERAVRSTSDSTVRYAIGKVLQSVRDLETQISSTVPGAAKQLSTSRSITGPYFDAFFKSPEEMPRALAQSLREQTPGEVKTKAQDDRLDRIAAYDPSIKTLATHIDNLEEALKKAPKPLDFRRGFTQLPEKPETVRAPKPEPLQDFTPKEHEPIQLPKPNRNLPEKPVDQQADLQELKEANAKKTANVIRNLGIRRAFYTAAAGAPAVATAFAFGKGIPAVLADLASVPIVIGGSHLLANLLEKPEVISWLSKITPKDVAAWNELPAEQKALFKDDMSKLVKDAVAKKMNVSPAMKAFVSGTAASQKNKGNAAPGPQSMNLQGVSGLIEEAKQRKPIGGIHNIVDLPGVQPSQQASTKPYTHIFNPQTGQIDVA